MRIRKLSMQGFKSFADRATFQFGDGVSGVVGPNGCGKSNVVDAVKWCLGEQSARSLRGDAMADVIFGGSSTRPPVQFAEVSLTFGAGSEPFPGIWARYAEIDVTRRLHRDGHSEYLINQERVRLRDIADLFMDSGVGNQLYSFIEQGRIGQIVQARPEQRRTLIEEAAGISRYKARREETLSKLESTRTALERVADLADEMGRQLRAAERAVQKAAKWRWLSAKVRQEEVAVGLIRCAGLAGDRKALSERLRAVNEEVEEAGRAVDRHEQELAARRLSQEAVEDVVGRARDRLAELEAERRVEESALQYQSRETEAARIRVAKLGEDQVAVRKERDSAHAEADARGRAGTDAEAALGRSRANAEAATLVAREHGRAVHEARVALDGARMTERSALEAVVRARAVLAGIGPRRAELEARGRRLSALQSESRVASTHVDEEIARVLAAVGVAEQEVARGRAAVDAERARVAEGERARDVAGRAVREAEQTLIEATRKREGVRARVDALLDQERRHVDAPDGVRAALNVTGVLGTLASQLTVPESLETPLARALEGGLDTVLVPDVATAVAAARAVGAGRVRLLIGGQTFTITHSPTVAGGLFADVVGTPAGTAALRRLAPLVQAAASLEEALSVWQPGHRILTPEAVVREDGVILMGADAAAGTATLRRRRELATGTEALAQLDRGVQTEHLRVEAARGARLAAEAEVTALSAGVEAARASARSGEVALAEARHRLDLHRAEKAQAVRAAEQILQEANAIAKAAVTLDREEAEADTARRDAEARQGAAETQIRQAQRALEVSEPALRAAEEETSRHRVDAAGAQRDLVAAREAGEAARRRAELAGNRSVQVEQERSDLEARLVQLGLDTERSTARVEELGVALSEVRVEMEARREEAAALRERVRAAEAAARSARDRRDGARERHGEIDRKLYAVRADLDRLRAEVEERHGVQLVALLDRLDRDGQVLIEGHVPEVVPGLPPLDPIPVARVTAGDLEGSVQERSDALGVFREQFGKLGDVNLGAEEEYREAADRHGDLERQRADLAEAMRIIEEAIGKINRTCRDRFRETFDLVNGHFAEVYPRLVGGGVAKLELTDEDDLLTCGVDIVVQPPGKRVQNLSLLSGGEKAMAAIALIFSLFRVKPSPFCLLDEVDAPLDEGNGARFNEMLREMCTLAQFIVITHNKKTMERADVLYGVTMPEPGVSRLVTVKIDG